MTSGMDKMLEDANKLREKHGDEHPEWRKADWRSEVENDETVLGYWEWVAHQVESGRLLIETAKRIGSRIENV